MSFCRIKRTNESNGIVQEVYKEDGTPSSLFRNLLNKADLKSIPKSYIDRAYEDNIITSKTAIAEKAYLLYRMAMKVKEVPIVDGEPKVNYLNGKFVYDGDSYKAGNNKSISKTDIENVMNGSFSTVLDQLNDKYNIKTSNLGTFKNGDDIYIDLGNVQKTWDRTSDIDISIISEILKPLINEVSSEDFLTERFPNNFYKEAKVALNKLKIDNSEMLINILGASFVQKENYDSDFLDEAIGGSMSKDEEELYKNIVMDSATISQKVAVHKIVKNAALTERDDENHIYTVKGYPTQEFTSVHSALEQSTGLNGEEDYYASDINGEEYVLNREWGNQADFILERFIQGAADGEILAEIQNEFDEVYYSDEVIKNLLKRYKTVLPKDGSVYLTQMMIHNVATSIAGSPDILKILPNGAVQIIDLKSSIYPFVGNYKTKSGFINNFNKKFVSTRDSTRTTKASKKEKYEGQLTFYYGMLKSLGLVVHQSDPVTLIPLQLFQDKKNPNHISKISIPNKLMSIDLAPNINYNQWGIEKNILNSTLTTHKFNQLITDMSKVILEKVNTMDETEVDKNVYNKWLRFLSTTDTYAKFINNLESVLRDLEGNTSGTWNGWFNIIEEFTNDVRTGQLDPEINADIKGNELRNALSVYLGVLKSFESMVGEFESTTQSRPNNESYLGKIQNLITRGRLLENKLNEQLLDIVATKLDDSTINKEERYDEIVKVVKEILDKLSKLESATGISDAYRRIQTRDLNKRLSRRMLNLKGAYKIIKDPKTGSKKLKKINSNKDRFKLFLNNGSPKDISWQELFMTPIISSSNNILSTIGNIFDDNIEEARQKAMKTHKTVVQYFDAYKKVSKEKADNPAKFNEGIYEKITIKYLSGAVIERMHFRESYGWSAYYEERNKEVDRLIKMIAEGLEDKDLALDKLSRWETKNTRSIVRGEKVTDPSTGETLLVRKGVKDIIEEKKAKFLKRYGDQKSINPRTGKEELTRDIEYKEWESTVKIPNNSGTGMKFHIKSTIVPREKYASKVKFDQKEKQEYRDILLYTYLKQQEHVSYNNKMFTQIPSIFKSDNDRIRENGFTNTIKENVNDLFTFDEAREEEEYGIIDGVAIPMEFSNRSIKVDDVSLDLTSSVLRYNHAVEKYKVRKQLYPIAKLTLDQLQKAKPIKTNSKGQVLFRRAINKFNKATLAKDENNKIAKMLEHFIEAQLQLKKRDTDNEFLSKPTQKFFSGLMSFQAFGSTSILKPLSNIANSLTASMNVRVEAFSKRYLSTKALMRAEKITFTGGEADRQFSENFGKSLPNNFHSALLHLYDPIKGRWQDHSLRKVSQSALKRMTGGDTLFWGQNRGEFLAQYKMFVGMLVDTKAYKMENGVKIEKSLYDVISYKDGEIVMEDKWFTMDGNDRNYTPFNRDMQRRMHAINIQMHGLYYKETNPVVLNRYAIGNILMMYRSFLPTNLRSRFGTEEGYYDTSIQDWRFGQYKALASYISYAVKDLIEHKKIMSPASIFTEQEKYGARRAATELMFILAILLTRFLVKAAVDDDDKDTWMYNATIYSLFRLQVEMQTYIDPFSLFRSFRSPFASYSLIEKFIRLVLQLAGDPTFEDRYKGDAGIAKKGDLKNYIYLLKLLGINGQTTDPKHALKMLELSVN